MGGWPFCGNWTEFRGNHTGIFTSLSLNQIKLQTNVSEVLRRVSNITIFAHHWWANVFKICYKRAQRWRTLPWAAYSRYAPHIKEHPKTIEEHSQFEVFQIPSTFKKLNWVLVGTALASQNRVIRGAYNKVRWECFPVLFLKGLG